MDPRTEGNLWAVGSLLTMLLIVIAVLVMLWCSGCCQVRVEQGLPGYLNDINDGRYELKETAVWYKGRWVPVQKPKRIVAPEARKGPRA